MIIYVCSAYMKALIHIHVTTAVNENCLISNSHFSNDWLNIQLTLYLELQYFFTSTGHSPIRLLFW